MSLIMARMGRISQKRTVFPIMVLVMVSNGSGNEITTKEKIIVKFRFFKNGVLCFFFF